ncbi:MAG: lipoprotein-releasing ABC transporter permease subunit [Desulfobacterales bacterium]
MNFEYFIGLRYLRARQQDGFISLITFLSVAGVTVGVMALIVVIAVMAGFETDLKNRILGVESHIFITREKGNFSDYQRILDLLAQRKEITAATPVIHTQTMLRSTAGSAGAVLRGIDPGSAGLVHRNLAEANPEKLKGEKTVPGIILGRELARNLGLAEGDELYLISPRGMVSPVGHMPSMKKFRVAGIFVSGMYEYDGTIAYIHMDAARKMLRMDDAVTGIEIRVEQIYAAEKIGRSIAQKLGADYVVKDWTEMNRTFFSALKLEKTAMFVILTLIILVAAFNIASSLIMMVMEKKQDIAILRAMGATDRSIRKIFVFKGLTIGCIGTALGSCAGIVLCFLLKHYKFIELPSDVYYITTLPVRLEGADVLAIAAAAVLICFLATLYPAGQAAKLDPVEAIRYG